MLGGAVDEWTEDKHKLFCGICVHLVLVFDKNHYYTAALWAGKVSKRCECRLAGQGPSYASLYQAICLQHNNNIVVYLWRRTQTHGAIHMTKAVKTAHLRTASNAIAYACAVCRFFSFDFYSHGNRVWNGTWVPIHFVHSFIAVSPFLLTQNKLFVVRWFWPMTILCIAATTLIHVSPQQ